MAKYTVDVREGSGCLGALAKVGIALLVIVVVLASIVQACKGKEDTKPTPTVPMPSTIAAETFPGETAAPAQPQKIFLGEHVAAYKKQSAQEYNAQNGRHFSMGGLPFYRGMTIEGSGFAFYNLSAYSFKKMKGQIGCLDEMYIEAQGTISFYGDDILIKQIKLKPDKLPVSFEIDISGVNQLRINSASSGNGYTVRAGLADVTFE